MSIQFELHGFTSRYSVSSPHGSIRFFCEKSLTMSGQQAIANMRKIIEVIKPLVASDRTAIVSNHAVLKKSRT